MTARKPSPTPRKRAPRKPPEPPKPENVEEAVRADIARLGDLPVGAATLAASALQLAREIDAGRNSATSKSMCARALHEAMEKLIALAPAKRAPDKLDDLAAKRAERLSKLAK